MNATKLLISFLTVIVSLCINQAYAQPTYPIDKGVLKLGGGLSFTSTGTKDEDRSTAFSISPSVEVFVIPGLAVGGSVGFSSYTIAGGGDRSNMLGVGPRVSYYIGNEDSRIFPFVAGSYSFNKRLEEDGFNTQSAQGSVGAAFMIARNVAIKGELFILQNSSNFSGQTSNYNTFGLQFGMDMFVFGGRD